MSAKASQVTGASSVYFTGCFGADKRKHQSSVSLCFVRGIDWWPVTSPHKGPVTRKMFPFDDVITHGFDHVKWGCSSLSATRGDISVLKNGRKQIIQARKSLITSGFTFYHTDVWHNQTKCIYAIRRLQVVFSIHIALITIIHPGLTRANQASIMRN